MPDVLHPGSMFDFLIKPFRTFVDILKDFMDFIARRSQPKDKMTLKVYQYKKDEFRILGLFSFLKNFEFFSPFHEKRQ